MPDLLIVTDSQGLYSDLSSVLEAPGTSIRWVRSGFEVRGALDDEPADLAIVDMQIGTMGGIAVAFDVALESEAGRIEAAPVLLTLDRRADVFLARRADVQGWLLKPLDPIRIRRAVRALLAGDTYFDTTDLPQLV